MNIFLRPPLLTPAHRKRILPHLGNVRTTLRPWLATNPSQDDLKRAVIMEVERAKASYDTMATVNRGVLVLLLKRIQKNDLSEINSRILKELKS